MGERQGRVVPRLPYGREGKGDDARYNAFPVTRGVTKIAGVLLAAGRGTRFGGDKLAADLAGLPLAHHAARTVAALDLPWRFAVVGAGDPPPGFTGVANPDPAAGQGRSLALGVAAARRAGAEAVLVMLGDMPCVPLPHLRRVLDRYRGADTLVASGDGVRRMPPALFGSGCFPRLEGVAGDRGARGWLADAEVVLADPEQLRDVDRPADLAAVRARLTARGA